MAPLSAFSLVLLLPLVGLWLGSCEAADSNPPVCTVSMQDLHQRTRKDVSVSCDGHFWPSKTDPAFVVPYKPLTEYLQLSNLVIRDGANQVQPIPPAPSSTNLIRLTFGNITVSGEPEASLPLQQLTARLNKTGLLELALLQVKLDITENFFEGFSGLRTLLFNNCTIVGLHVDSFKALAGGAFQELTLEEDTKLTSFPWAVLSPVANSITKIKLNSNAELAEITPAASPQPVFPRLYTLEIKRSKLHSLPAFVLEAYGNCSSTTPVAPFDTCQLEFVFNQHDCTNCATFEPLIAWTQAGSARNAWVTCEKKAPGAEGDMEGGKDFWQQRSACGKGKSSA